MSTLFPNNLDNFVNPTATDQVSVISHADQHADNNDATTALEVKVGIDNDTNTDSHDYKLSEVDGVGVAVSTEGNQTINGNKVFTGTTTTEGLQAGTGDITTTGNISGADITSSGKLESDTFQLNNDVVELSEGGTGSNIVPPIEDKILFYDVSDNSTDLLTVGDNLQIVDKEISAVIGGLSVQASFIDQIRTTLKFSTQQTATTLVTTGTASPVVGNNSSTSDSITFTTTYNSSSDPQISQFTYNSNTNVFTNSGRDFEVSTVDRGTTYVHQVDDTNVIVFGQTASATTSTSVYGAHLSWNGSTWIKIENTTMPQIQSFNTFTDVLSISSTNYRVININTSSTSGFVTIKQYFSNISLGIDATYTERSFQILGLIVRDVRFIDEDTIVVLTSDNMLQAWDISTTTPVELGNALSVNNSQFIFPNKGTINPQIITESGSNIFTYEFDGTDWSLVSQSASTNLISNRRIVVLENNVFLEARTSGREWTLIGEGTEFSIEDTLATGNLGYMAGIGTTSTGTTSTDIVIQGSTSNDGTYSPTSYTLNKLIFGPSVGFTEETTPEVLIACDLSDNQGQAWIVKGNNYYLGNG